MKESIHLIGGLLGHVCQHDLFKCVQIFKWLNIHSFVQFQMAEHK